jgi:hypothetical protein
MLVLQLYEGMLVGLGAFLVRTGRAPRDGRIVLALESLFLMDATLLVAESVTADARVGTAVAAASLGLAASKLAWVRRTAPGLLSKRAAVLLGLQAAGILAVPVAAAHLARARLLDSIVLYGLSWAALALPAAQRALRHETRAEADAAPRAHEAWAWVPSALVFLHLWAVGYIHTIGFRPAFVAPFLLGLAVTAGRGQLLRQLVPPVLAVLCSLGQGATLGFHVLGADGLFLSPLRLAAAGALASWTYLAWRDRERWLAILALGCAAGASVGSRAHDLTGALGRLLDAVVPRSAFGWGVLTVIAAYVLLAAGARRSLGANTRWPFGGPAGSGDSLRRKRDLGAMAVALAVLAISAMLAAFGASTWDPRQTSAAGLATPAAAAAFVLAILARRRAQHEGTDPVAPGVAGLAMAAAVVGGVMALGSIAAFDNHGVFRAETQTIGHLRTMIAAPPKDLPEGAFEKTGYRFTRAPGPTAAGAWLAVPIERGRTGVRGFCGDSSGVVCFTVDGKAPGVEANGRCDLATCTALQ